MHSPELLSRVQKTGEYLRYNTNLPKRLTELAILIVAKHWGQPVEWNIHYPIAIDAGVKQSDIDAISVDDVPPSLDTDQRLVYDFCRSLLRNGVVDDVLYMQLETVISAKGVVDLTALCGYYTLLAMVMNVARTPG
jgi:4-carboxymuconolactone decarboxylase